MMSFDNIISKAVCLNQPHRAFLCIALLFGFIYIAISPPFIPLDEDHHLTRIIGLSEGHLLSPAEAPIAFNEFISKGADKVPDPKDRNTPYSFRETYHALLEKPDTKNSQITTLNYNRAIIYFPAAYISAIPFVFLAMHINVSPIVTLYISRLSIFLGSTILIYYALKITPVLKWPLFFIALWPTTVFIRSSISADPLTLGYIFLFTALVLSEFYSESQIVLKKTTFLSLLALLICLSKTAYFLLPCMAIILPQEKFSSRKQYIIFLFSVCVAPIVLDVLWLILTSHTFYNFPIADAHAMLEERATEHEQLLFFLNNPFNFIWVIANTCYTRGLFLIEQAIAINGSFPEFSVSLPQIITTPLFLLLFFLPFHSPEKHHAISDKNRALLGGIFCASCGIIFFIFYITFNRSVMLETVHGLQGRYFTPLLPLLFLALPHKAFSHKAHRYFIPCLILLVIALLVQNLLSILSFDYYWFK